MTGTNVFNSAMSLLMEDSNCGDIDVFKNKSLDIINLLLNEFPRPTQIDTLEDEIYNDIAAECIPYGLAAALILEEDANRAAILRAKYLERKNAVRTAKQGQIKRVI